jgi:uroporphyrinogen-III synthase
MRVVITRPAEQAAELAELVAERGGEPVLLPTIQVVAVPLMAEDTTALTHIAQFDWLVVTSRNGVRFLAEALAGQPLPQPPLKIAAVGEQTAVALAQHGWTADFVPASFSAADLAAELGNMAGQRLLLIRGNLANPALAQAWQAAGAQVTAVTLYQTIPAVWTAEQAAVLSAGAEVLTFTSPSTFTNFRQLGGATAEALLATARIATLGPTTSAAIRTAGYPVHIQPAVQTVAALVEAIFNG